MAGARGWGGELFTREGTLYKDSKKESSGHPLNPKLVR